MAQVPFRSSGMFGAQPGADLLRAPRVLEFGLHHVPQFGVDDECTDALAASFVAGTRMGEIGVIDTLVVWLEVTTQLA